MRPTDTHTEKDGEGSRGGGGREKERRPGSKSQLLLQLRHNVWVTVCAHIRVSILTYTHDDTRERARTHTQHACVSVHENSHFNFGQAEAGMSFMHSLLELLHLVLLLLHSRFKLFLRLALPKMEKALKKKRLTGATGADINANLVVQGLLQHLNRVALLVHVLLCVSCVRWPNPLCVCVCVCVCGHIGPGTCVTA